ncbi:MAG TPA: DUF1838 domain-containing protein [Candidatus Obscuribacterales bacterium]
MVAVVQEFDAKTFVKVRASLDSSEQSWLTWAGSIYAFIPGEKRQRLFKMVGMSVSRCLPAEQEGVWDFVSRELTYYLDPHTNEILHQWNNPWTGEILPVMHVANNPVQAYFQGQFPAQVDGEIATFAFDLFPTYPNPLAEEEQFREYSPQAIYQAAELFKLTVPLTDLLNPELNSVSRLHLGWDRIGPWLPWMKMGDRPGQLIYSAYGSRVNGLADLPQPLQSEINTRVPAYKSAPQSLQDESDLTSWLYFKQYFAAYLAGATFPIPE